MVVVVVEMSLVLVEYSVAVVVGVSVVVELIYGGVSNAVLRLVSRWTSHLDCICRRDRCCRICLGYS
jgi:hypothetical protein